MKLFFKLLGGGLIIFALLVGFQLFHFRIMAGDESYPIDSFFDRQDNKKALIIVAHDDDMVSTTGTLRMLSGKGWHIGEMCFYQSGGLYGEKDSRKNPVRKESLRKSAGIQGLADLQMLDFNLRRDIQKKEAWLPMPYDQFENNYLCDSLYKVIGRYIEEEKPTAIFTLDHVIGGYGHPDHVFISQLILKYCLDHRYDTSFSVQRIYEPVFPPTQASSVLGNMKMYRDAKKIYACTGMPAPDVAFDVSCYSREKKNALQAYSTEQNSLQKIWPYYNWYPHWVYFGIFNREFFHVIEVGELSKENIFL